MPRSSLVVCVRKSSRRYDPAEFSGTFWNFSLVYKFCNSLFILIGLQRNTPYSKTNQCATAFLQQCGIWGPKFVRFWLLPHAFAASRP